MILFAAAAMIKAAGRGKSSDYGNSYQYGSDDGAGLGCGLILAGVTAGLVLLGGLSYCSDRACKKEAQKIESQRLELIQKIQQEKNHSRENRRNITLEGRAININFPDGKKDMILPVEDFTSNVNGWTIFYNDIDSKQVKEVILVNEGAKSVKVVQDIVPPQQRFVEINDYFSVSQGYWTGTYSRCNRVYHPSTFEAYNATIHINADDRLGVERGKNIQNAPQTQPKQPELESRVQRGSK